MTVGAAVADGMLLHRIAPRDEARDRVAALLARVGLPPEAAARPARRLRESIAQLDRGEGVVRELIQP
jgi:peptide/nickel transport system ATP-binding protein